MKKTILVTAIGSFSAVTVIESLKKQGHRVVGCDIYPAEWVANSAIADVFYKAPYATDRPAYMEFITTVCRKEDVAFVMPLTDVEIDLFRSWETAAEDTGAVICMSERKMLDICRNKKRLREYLEPIGICHTIPGTMLSEIVKEISERYQGLVYVDGSYEVLNGYEMLDYPVVIKPVDGRSSQGLYIARSEKEMELIVGLCKEEMDRYLVQPKIEGSIITVDVVRDPKNDVCVCIPRRELLRTSNGAGTSVFVFKNEYLEQQCSDIARALNICGCVNFEFVEEQEPERTNGPGKWRFLECNPRFSGGLAFSAVAGYDMVKNHLNCFMGMEIEPEGERKELFIARRYNEHIMG